MTIRQKLNELIKTQNYVSYDGIAEYCKILGCKSATAYRELRPSHSPMVIPVWNGNAISGYKWREENTIYKPSITAQEFLKKYPSKKEKTKELTLF